MVPCGAVGGVWVRAGAQKPAPRRLRRVGGRPPHALAARSRHPAFCRRPPSADRARGRRRYSCSRRRLCARCGCRSAYGASVVEPVWHRAAPLWFVCGGERQRRGATPSFFYRPWCACRIPFPPLPPPFICIYSDVAVGLDSAVGGARAGPGRSAQWHRPTRTRRRLHPAGYRSTMRVWWRHHRVGTPR